MTNKSSSKFIYWTKTKRHDEAGVLIIGPVVLPVTVAIVGVLMLNILVMIILALVGSGVAWAVYGMIWGAAFGAYCLFCVGALFVWLYQTLRDANGGKVEN